MEYKDLNQEMFDTQPFEVNWIGVDQDGTLHYGFAYDPRIDYISNKWVGYSKIGQPVVNSGYKPLTSIWKLYE